VAPPPVEVVDTIAAGDAFCGALAAALDRGADLPLALRHGVAAGSLACTRSGAQPSLPLAAAIAAVLAAGW
jgi:ribokinase